MKITVYTVSQCQFSKAEKEYLQLHNLPFEEKNLEQNREWLTEMLVLSNNFAGTPVTKIEKDDGSIVVLKGFTKEEFDKELGLDQPPVAQANAQVNLPQPPAASQPATESPTQPPQSTSSTSQSQPPTQPPTPPSSSQPSSTPNPASPSPSQEPTTNASVNDQLNSILEDLQKKSETPSFSQVPQSDTPPTNLPNIPDFSDKS